jgi:hypothetical protein
VFDQVTVGNEVPRQPIAELGELSNVAWEGELDLSAVGGGHLQQGIATVCPSSDDLTPRGTLRRTVFFKSPQGAAAAMASLIEDIQLGALDPASSISSLLRKMKFAASKLDIPNLESWVDQELDGYLERDDGPKYRKLRGQVRLRDVFGRWQPLAG